MEAVLPDASPYSKHTEFFIVLQLANGYTTLPIFSQPDLLAYRSLVNAVLG